MGFVFFTVFYCLFMELYHGDAIKKDNEKLFGEDDIRWNAIQEIMTSLPFTFEVDTRFFGFLDPFLRMCNVNYTCVFDDRNAKRDIACETEKTDILKFVDECIEKERVYNNCIEALPPQFKLPDGVEIVDAEIHKKLDADRKKVEEKCEHVKLSDDCVEFVKRHDHWYFCLSDFLTIRRDVQGRCGFRIVVRDAITISEKK